MRTILPALAVLIVTALLVAVPNSIASKAERHLQLNDSHGKIYLPWGTAVFLLLFCFGFVAVGILSIIADPRMTWIGLSLVVLFGYGAWCTLWSSKSDGSVSWDEQGIQGPRRVYPIPYCGNRGKLRWENISSYQDLPHGIIIVRSDDGRKLTWSSHFVGSGFLKDLIRRKCPGIKFK